MFMKLYLTILFSLVVMSATQAQLFLDNCNPMIKSLEKVVYVVRQDYALEDQKGDLFGQGGNDYFGYAYGPAVAIDGELVFSHFTYKPYNIDTSYRSFGAEYKPQSTTTYIKRLTDSSMKVLKSDINQDVSFVRQPLTDSSSLSSISGFSVTDSMNCVVVIFLSESKPDPESAPYKLSYLNSSVKWEKNNTGKLLHKDLGSGAVFGLIFYEKVGFGQVNYVLGGFVEKVDKTWKVIKYQKLNSLSIIESDNDKKKKKKKKK